MIMFFKFADEATVEVTTTTTASPSSSGKPVNLSIETVISLKIIHTD